MFRIAVGLVVCVLSASSALAQPGRPRSQRQPRPIAASSRPTRGVVLNFVKADKTADFESVMVKLKEALAKSAKPERKAQAAAPAKRVFAATRVGLNFIKADKTADFEAVMAKLKEALQKSDKPERKQQAASWKVFKSPEPAPAATCSTSS